MLLPQTGGRNSATTSPILFSTALAFFGCVLLAHPARPEGPTKPSVPPEAEKIGEDLYRIGKARVDLKAKTVTCSGKVNMNRGTIEYVAVGPRGKRHESVLAIDVNPLHFQVGLILIGLEPKGGLSRTPNPRKTQGAPAGSPVDVWVSWQRNGRPVRVRAEELAWDIDKKHPMERNAWIFSGALAKEDWIVPEEDLSLVATYRDPAAVINNALPGGLDDTIYKSNERIVPPVGTPVTLMVTSRDGQR